MFALLVDGRHLIIGLLASIYIVPNCWTVDIMAPVFLLIVVKRTRHYVQVCVKLMMIVHVVNVVWAIPCPVP